jgi:hypothetical protein
MLENGLDVDPVFKEKIGNILSDYLEEGGGLAGFGKRFFCLTKLQTRLLVQMRTTQRKRFALSGFSEGLQHTNR